MTDQPRAIVRDAIDSLRGFEFTDVDTALLLLSSWARRNELSVADIRAVVAHYRTAPNGALTLQAPEPGSARAMARFIDSRLKSGALNLAAPAVPLLTENDPAPAGAVRGKDRDGDDWHVLATGRWRHDELPTPRTTKSLVRVYGPIDWFDADDNLIGRSAER